MTSWTVEALASKARKFCDDAEYQSEPFGKRNWGGQLHSLCSYQGKLKPSIAHFLIQRFTSAGDSVLDPMSGVGTVPLEARRLGRVGFAGDLSPLAHIVSRAKLEPIVEAKVWDHLIQLEFALASGKPVVDAERHSEFGLNRTLREYFHPDTLSEILLARQFFLDAKSSNEDSPELSLVWTAVLHILHGNRPYSLSRRSHPITPFAPRGEFEYKSVLEYTRRRLHRVLSPLLDLQTQGLAGRSIQQSFEGSADEFGKVDSVITSPPFAQSLRFWSSNWMRLWFSGWDPLDFKDRPGDFLESRQRKSMDVYSEFSQAMATVIKPAGSLILHLGETKSLNMAREIEPLLGKNFDVAYVGRESVESGETHGLKDKGSTVAHGYLFAVRKG